MNQERAILHFNKFKSLRNAYVRDTLRGRTLKVVKVKLVKNTESDYEVRIFVESELDQKISEIDSAYAHANFKVID